MTNLLPISEDYLKDESGLYGKAEYVTFPETMDEIIEILRTSKELNEPITIQGGRTGLCGGAIPLNGIVINLNKLNKMKEYHINDNHFFITVQSGMTIEELSRQIYIHSDNQFFFPVNTTEVSATIGGIISCNCRGARSSLYGGIFEYINQMTLIDAEGNEHFLKKSDNAKDPLPGFQCCGQDDLRTYIGSEGSLGIIYEITLRLPHIPTCVTLLLTYFETLESLNTFLIELKHCQIRISMAEWMDSSSIHLIRSQESSSRFKKLPSTFPIENFSLLLEIESNSDDKMMNDLSTTALLLEKYGINSSAALAAVSSYDRDNLDLLRHACIKAASDKTRLNAPFTKTTNFFLDVDVPTHALPILYKNVTSASPYNLVCNGHALLGHTHIHIIPPGNYDYDKINDYTNHVLKQVLSLGGNLSSDFGIGKNRCNIFSNSLINRAQLMKVFKTSVDKQNLMGRGNFFI